MGGCQSLYYEDEEEKAIRRKHKQQQKELNEFIKQLRLQKCFSELDLDGKPIIRERRQNK